MTRRDAGCRALVLMNFDEAACRPVLPAAEKGAWEKLLESADAAWLGPGATLPERLEQGNRLEMPGRSIALYRQLPPRKG
jgi:hypothetical protein